MADDLNAVREDTNLYGLPHIVALVVSGQAKSDAGPLLVLAVSRTGKRVRSVLPGPLGQSETALGHVVREQTASPHGPHLSSADAITDHPWRNPNRPEAAGTAQRKEDCNGPQARRP